ncbi:MAG: putative amino-acid metabolite efflux pump [Candidatus Heimdallarchaeota archaeon LC_3]|nr:MAG: putative amino-acid metabolite efflux pump [Candidatus Heimdallarchaeota archaeon LC_3]
MSTLVQRNQSDFSAYVLMAVTVIIWGSTWPLGRSLFTEENVASTPPLIIATIRYYIVVPVFLIVLRLREKSFHIDFLKRHWKELLIMGFISVTIYQFGYLYGVKNTTGSDSSLVISTSPIWVLLITTIFFKYKLTLRKVFGVFLGFFGVFLVSFFLENEEMPTRLLGNGLVLMAAVAYASYTVILKQMMLKYQNNQSKPSSLTIVTWVSVLGLITLIPVNYLISPEFLSINPYFDISPWVWFGILYLAFLSTIFAYLTYVEGVNRLDANRAVIFVNFIPLIGIVLSGLFLGEKIDIVIHSISLILILSGVTLVNKKSNNNSSSMGQDDKREEIERKNVEYSSK